MTRFQFVQVDRHPRGTKRIWAPVPVAAMRINMKDDFVRSFKDGLLRPRRDPFMMRVQAGTFRELWVLYEQLGQTTGATRWVRKPSDIDVAAGRVARLRIPGQNRPPLEWTVECACLMLSGLDPKEDKRAIAEFQRTNSGVVTDDDSFNKAVSSITPLAAAFSVNRELLENPVLSTAVYCFAEAFFGQFGVSVK